MMMPIHCSALAALACILLVTGCSSAHQTEDASDAGSAATGPSAPAAPSADGGHDDGLSPKACTTEPECGGACPPSSKGCTCAQTPNGGLCIPTCTADTDCPAGPTGPHICSAEHTCIPKGGIPAH